MPSSRNRSGACSAICPEHGPGSITFPDAACHSDPVVIMVTRALGSWAAACLAGLVLTGCAVDAEPPEPLSADVRILAIGDSILDFNGDESTPDQVGALLRERGVDAGVENRAVGGACLQECTPDDPPITEQYSAGDWDIVLITGGANDIGDACASPDPTIDGTGTSGAMVGLIDAITGDGAAVVIMGYSPAVISDSPVNTCPGFQQLGQRYSALAEQRDDVDFVDLAEVVNQSTPELYADDVHPNVEGSRASAAVIAEVIQDRLHS